MKKLFIIFLTVVLLATTLIACRENGGAQNTNGANGQGSTQAPTTAAPPPDDTPADPPTDHDPTSNEPIVTPPYSLTEINCPYTNAQEYEAWLESSRFPDKVDDLREIPFERLSTTDLAVASDLRLFHTENVLIRSRAELLAYLTGRTYLDGYQYCKNDVLFPLLEDVDFETHAVLMISGMSGSDIGVYLHKLYVHEQALVVGYRTDIREGDAGCDVVTPWSHILLLNQNDLPKAESTEGPKPGVVQVHGLLYFIDCPNIDGDTSWLACEYPRVQFAVPQYGYVSGGLVLLPTDDYTVIPSPVTQPYQNANEYAAWLDALDIPEELPTQVIPFERFEPHTHAIGSQKAFNAMLHNTVLINNQNELCAYLTHIPKQEMILWTAEIYNQLTAIDFSQKALLIVSGTWPELVGVELSKIVLHENKLIAVCTSDYNCTGADSAIESFSFAVLIDQDQLILPEDVDGLEIYYCIEFPNAVPTAGIQYAGYPRVRFATNRYVFEPRVMMFD